MKNHFKNSIVCLCFAILFLLGQPSHAQIRTTDDSFKDSLIQVLYQYAKEVYHRGLDPQEASYTFQRILVLDCRHKGAQDYLQKIRNKYPTVSIRIFGCTEEEKRAINSDILEMPEESPRSSLREERLGSNRIVIPVKSKKSDNVDTDDMKLPSAPLRALAEPVDMEVTSSAERFQEDGSIDNFPIIETQKLDTNTPSQNGHQNDMNGLAQDCDQLRLQNAQLTNEISLLMRQIEFKDDAITRYQKEIASIYGSADPSYALIAQDQKELIRVQQENIDQLEKELALARSQLSRGELEVNSKYNELRGQIADAQLSAKETEINFEVKNREAQLLNKQKVELEEQLNLVRKILTEKNEIIQALQDELQAVETEIK